jgi:hypothetical protein
MSNRKRTIGLRVSRYGHSCDVIQCGVDLGEMRHNESTDMLWLCRRASIEVKVLKVVAVTQEAKHSKHRSLGSP